MRFWKGGLLVSLICLATIAALVAGCGGDDTAANSQTQTGRTIPVISDAAKNLDPCSLITKSEVADAMGQPAKDPVRQGTSCTYDSVDVSNFAQVLVIAQPGTMDDYNFQLNELAQGKGEPIDGLGAAAAYTSDKELLVQQHDVLITIDSFGNITKDNLKTLAEKAVERVP